MNECKSKPEENDLVPPLVTDEGEPRGLCVVRPDGAVTPLRFGVLAKLLSQQGNAEWQLLEELGALKGDSTPNDMIDEIMRVMMRTLSPRPWDQESGFTLQEVLNLAQRLYEHPPHAERLRLLEERAQLIDMAMDENLLWPPAGGTRVDALKHTGVRARGYDHPENDATDAAHPAWWRGSDHGSEQTAEKLRNYITEVRPEEPAFASEKMNAVANGILALRLTVRTLADAITDLRCSTVLSAPKPDCLTDEMWEDLQGLYERLKSG